MRKVTWFVLILAALFALVACGSNEDSDGKQASKEESGYKNGELTFNDTAVIDDSFGEYEITIHKMELFNEYDGEKPDDGQLFAFIDYTFENTGEYEMAESSITGSGLKLEDGSDFPEREMSYYAYDFMTDKERDIAAGESVDNQFYFQVDEAEDGVYKLIYEPYGGDIDEVVWILDGVEFDHEAAAAEAMEEVSLDLTDSIDQAVEFYEEIYFTDSEVVNDDVDWYGIESIVYFDDGNTDYEANIWAYTIEPEASLDLKVLSGTDSFEEVKDKTDIRGDSLSEQVRDDAYEFTSKLHWVKDGNTYIVDGGRHVISTNKDSELLPENDRLEVYENPTQDKQLNFDEDGIDFYKSAIVPTVLPKNFELKHVQIEERTKEMAFTNIKYNIRYAFENKSEERLYIRNYIQFNERDIKIKDETEVYDLNGVEVHRNDPEQTLIFSLNDELYRIYYEGLEYDDVEKVAESMIEQGK